MRGPTKAAWENTSLAQTGFVGKNRGPDNPRLRLELAKESATLNYNDL